MHPFIAKIITREKESLREFQFSLKKAFDLLGNVYAPIFFCVACLMGISLPLFAWKSGGVLNALLGARGVGTLTSELTQGMWMMIVALVIFFGTKMVLTRLEGKMHEVFMRLAYTCELIVLVLLSASALSVFFAHIFLFLLWKICAEKRIRVGIAIAWFLGLVWMFFSLATDVALRVSTLGDMVSVLAICALFFCAVTRPFFQKP
ncbi:MAG: hypothetical protein AAB448_01880 [Patescibacteria group bacterium]